MGATLVAAGPSAINGGGILSKVLVPAVASPVLAAAAALATYLAFRITRGRPEGTISRGFRIGQIASASMVSLAHGTNDAQKTMSGIQLASLIDFGALGRVAVISIVVGAGIVVAYSLGLAGVSQWVDKRAPAGLVVAALCFAICVAGVGSGLLVMLQK